MLEIEYAYTDGNSFSVGEDDLVRWLMATGWTITPPPGFEPHRFFTATPLLHIGPLQGQPLRRGSAMRLLMRVLDDARLTAKVAAWGMTLALILALFGRVC